MIILWRGLLYGLMIALLTASAMAQEPSPAQQTRQGQQSSVPAMPNAYKLNMMIRSSIIALNHANKTGNYTVLQDLGAPAFRAANNSTRLAAIFSQLRQRELDLSPILFFQPKLVREPMIAPNGVLRLTGYFETNPERVNFDLYFQQMNGDWRILGIGVTTSQASVTAAIPPQVQKPKQRPTSQKPRSAPKNVTAAAPPPVRKPSPPAKPENRSSKNGSSEVENRTTNNAVRIDLSTPQSADVEPTENEASTDGSFWNDLNPFATD